ncbi:unnamed protein product [Periconia digitata]|uniref:Phosphoglycerate mutase n=1 Tax=Periconia digitata TaxID=1303443 RepID=A0A9W4XPV8_9PLEO|nr:unnamed protein product [Periconia digitata]
MRFQHPVKLASICGGRSQFDRETQFQPKVVSLCNLRLPGNIQILWVLCCRWLRPGSERTANGLTGIRPADVLAQSVFLKRAPVFTSCINPFKSRLTQITILLHSIIRNYASVTMLSTHYKPQWKPILQHGYFQYDQCCGSSETFKGTSSSLQLINRRYPTDNEVDPQLDLTQWQRFEYYIRQLNNISSGVKVYKVMFLTTSCESQHHVKQREVGNHEWSSYWSTLSGKGTARWADAGLTSEGEKQAKRIAALWKYSINSLMVPIPEVFYSSPHRRCLQTLQLSSDLLLQQSTRPRPIIKENLRSQYGRRTCDQRSTRSWINRSYPSFYTEPGFTELDELWIPEKRESHEEQAVRAAKILDDVLNDEKATFLSITTHRDTARSILKITGFDNINITSSTIYPIVICGEREIKA